ncbi:MAG: nuclear transport factor 2 family protein [Pseudomonadota bacterium]|nr:nuclear transport factor 2 family protein [Pseudomonadota bacterium]
MREPSDRALIDFVVAEARLLDDRRYAEWNALWTDDGIYWVPLTPGQPDGLNHTSHLYEDKLLRTLRIERLKSARAYAQQPPSRAHHLLQTPTVESSDAGTNRFVLRTEFHYTEAQGEETHMFVGTVFHHLQQEGDALRLRLKRVDLINCDAALPAVQLFI